MDLGDDDGDISYLASDPIVPCAIPAIGTRFSPSESPYDAPPELFEFPDLCWGDETEQLVMPPPPPPPPPPSPPKKTRQRVRYRPEKPTNRWKNQHGDNHALVAPRTFPVARQITPANQRKASRRRVLARYGKLPCPIIGCTEVYVKHQEVVDHLALIHPGDETGLRYTARFKSKEKKACPCPVRGCNVGTTRLPDMERHLRTVHGIMD